MSEAARWYHAVVRDCRLSVDSFQLANGNIPLGYNSTSIWSILDCVPPDAFENYNPAPGNVFSTNYGAILSTLKAGGLVSAALDLWNAAGGFPAVKAYSGTIEDLQAGLESAPGATVTMRSGVDTEDLSGVWAQQGGDGEVGLFWRPTGASGSQPVPPPSGTVVEVRFDHVLTFVAGPLSKYDPLNEGLKDYKPWYNSAALKLALVDQGLWSAPGQWPAYFEAGTGSMLRCITSLVVVDGVTSRTRPPPALTLGLDSDDTAADSVGFWPFAVPPDGLSDAETAQDGERSGPMTVTAVDDGGVTIQSKPGNPLLLGVNVRELRKSLGAETADAAS